MKLTTFIILISLMQVSASTFGQKMTLVERSVSIEKVLMEIRKQTGYDVLIIDTKFDLKKRIRADFNSAPLELVMDRVVSGTDFTYKIDEKNVVLKQKEPSFLDNLVARFSAIDVRGKVIGENDEVLVGATVKVKGANISTTTNAQGEFYLRNVDESAVIVISYLGYMSKEVKVLKDMGNIILEHSENPLDEVQIIAYGTTTKRLNTGSVGTIKAVEIEKQPVSNILGALQGRVPGLLISETNGNPGAGFKVQIRGQNSIGSSIITDRVSLPASSPLFLVDGVPFPSADVGLIGGSFSLAAGNLSPLASLNPSDIASIEVLKDADATSIYGSRGANGVVIITTKRGEPDRNQTNINLTTGAGGITRKIGLLNTSQYITMRKEAFVNDGTTPTLVNAGDILGWDNNRYIDWQELLVGGTARFTNASVSLSGGNTGITYLISGNYNKQSSVYPGNYESNKGSLHTNITHFSTNKRLSAKLNILYSNDQNDQPTGDLINFITLSPNAPYPTDAYGNLVWSDAGFAFTNNPLARTFQKSLSTTDNLTSNLNLSYKLLPGLNILTSIGYTSIQVKQINTIPISSKAPGANVTGSATFGNSYYKNWIIEPQLDFNKDILQGHLNILVGTTFQEDNKSNNVINAEGYTNDDLISAPQYAGTAAQNLKANITETMYRYQAVFARINYNWDNKYLINVTGRRDGSSRFGPGKRFANFGALGAGWIFSQEDFIQKNMPFISFGKLRGSYGTTGSDQIADYGFLDTYSATAYGAGLIPTRLFNPDYAWELNRKLELAMELGAFRDRIMLVASWYRNRSGNQLISYKLPIQTGFASMIQNFDAEVQNTGWEISLNTINLNSNRVKWNTSFNITVPQNKLLRFPGIESSSYANALVVGKPITIQKYLDLTGVDPSTGIYQFAGINRPADQTVIKDMAPKYFGGMSNTVQYKWFELSCFIQFTKQLGNNFLAYYSNNAPGTLINQTLDVLSRWQNSGDQSDIQRYTTSGAARTAFLNYSLYSEARISDASFVRLKNVSLSYSFPETLLQRLRLNSIRVYVQAQNLATLTRFKGTDPETNAGGINLPPLRMITGGIQLNL